LTKPDRFSNTIGNCVIFSFSNRSRHVC
jgi:hypothetical protein